ncbi:hypothetical protein [Nonomuraea longicatena]|uniref:Uncharacterized protein n=1 Tax=Nonomuraea longicatena TaxID=83682 RepID=A0ABP3Z2A0_9ACTN
MTDGRGPDGDTAGRRGRAVKPGDWVVVVDVEDGDTAATAGEWAANLVGMHGVVLLVRGDSWARVRLDEEVDRRKVWRFSLLDLERWEPPPVFVPYAEVLCCGVAGDRGRVLHALADVPRVVEQPLPTLCGLKARAAWRGRHPMRWSAALPRTCVQCAWLAPLARARGPDLEV